MLAEPRAVAAPRSSAALAMLRGQGIEGE